jgi:CheY-like chemotaxis protein
MLKKILIIENDPDDFIDIKENLKDDWDIYPVDENKFNFSDIYSILSFVTHAINSDVDLVALIVDISLIGPEDDMGLELIRKIRGITDSIKYKIIPIFCYSRHEDMQLSAFKAGATNFFLKKSLAYTSNPRYKFLKQTMKALVFLYIDAIYQNQKLASFDIIMKELRVTHTDNRLILKAMLEHISFDEFERLVMSDNCDNELVNIIGDDQFEVLKNFKLKKNDREEFENQINDIADIIATIPAIGGLAGILKGIRLLSKKYW